MEQIWDFLKVKTTKAKTKISIKGEVIRRIMVEVRRK